MRRRRQRIRRVLLIWVGLLLLAGIVRACSMREQQLATPQATDRSVSGERANRNTLVDTTD